MSSLIELDYDLWNECPTCSGSGWVDIGDCEEGVISDCPTCEGSGVLNYVPR